MRLGGITKREARVRDSSFSGIPQRLGGVCWTCLDIGMCHSKTRTAGTLEPKKRAHTSSTQWTLICELFRASKR